MLRGFFLPACLLALIAGCQSRPLGPYSSPRVTGQVLQAGTETPLSNVRVWRAKPMLPAGERLKGGEWMIQPAPALTAADGRFEVPGERVLSVLRGPGWNLVPLTFEKTGYQTLHTNSPASGDGVLDIGRVWLTPSEPSPGADRD